MRIFRKQNIILLLFIIITVIVGCDTNSKPAFDINTITSYRDIPNITPEEITAIETLKTSRDGFSFSKLRSSEGFELANGKYAGFSPLFAQMMSDLFGIPFVLNFYEWDTIINGISNKTIDFTGELTVTPERQNTYIMSKPISHRLLGVLTYGDRKINTPHDLDGLRVGILRDQAIINTIAHAYPTLNFESVQIINRDDVDMLRNGKLDAIIGSSARLIYDFTGNDINISYDSLPLAYVSASLTTANPELAPIISVLNKYIAAGGMSKLYELHSAGVGEYKRHVLFKSFSDEELAYINSLTAKVPIVLGTDTYPVSFFNDSENEFQGIAKDVLTEISLMTGIEFEVVNSKDAEWSEILGILRTGQAALISDLIITEERKQYFIWPETPFFSTPYTFISRIDYPDLELYQIEQATVGVVGWCATRELYEKWFPNSSNMKMYDTQDDTLDALEMGDIDLFFNLGYILYYQKNYREKSSYKANYTFPVFNDIFFGLNKNETILRSIIDKTLFHIDTERIANSWTSRSFDYSKKLAEERARALAIFVMFLAILLAALLVFFVRSLRLRKKLEQTSAQLESALEQATAASKAKGDFLSAMSHEIRTPMNAIIGMTAIGKKAKDLEQKNYTLSKIGEASSHLLGIINDVLDMAKIEANKLELSPIRYNFEKMLQKVFTIVNFRIEEKQLHFTVNVDNSIPRFLVGDEQRLAQAITNLIANAIKFTPEGGNIWFSAFLVCENDGECELRIEVADSGIGITPEQQKKLFLAFEQAESGISREYGGTGLGLTISRSIIELMDGKIRVESELGKGARFIFTVKALRSKKDDDKAWEENDAKSGDEMRYGEFVGKTLLFVEDMEINREILVAMLEDTGILIDCAENGIEALEMIEAEPNKYDIVFMDVQMPKMNGIETTRRIRAMPERSRGNLPIIAMTANVFKDDIDECIAAGMNDHLGKPLDIDKILEKLRKYLA